MMQLLTTKHSCVNKIIASLPLMQLLEFTYLMQAKNGVPIYINITHWLHGY